VGLGYARLAREEYAWARAAFREALSLEPNNEDGLAGYGEVLLKLGHRDAALQCFESILALGFREDHDLIMQVGRALFREGLFTRAREFFELVLVAHPDSSEAASCLGYAAHRLGDDDAAVRWLRRGLELDPNDPEAQIYIGNVLYDGGDYDGALEHFDRTHPTDHIEELALWRYVELKKSMYRVHNHDPELHPWLQRLSELSGQMSEDDKVLAEIEATLPDGTFLDPHQLDFFETQRSRVQRMRQRSTSDGHRVTMKGGVKYFGTWEQIVLQMLRDDQEWLGGSLASYMEQVALRSLVETGVSVPSDHAEGFIKGIAAAGLLHIAS
jgi:tetratricopeptide (TPR) repeat protein